VDYALDYGMDWEQVRQNGGPPCFHRMEDGRLCGRAERWFGHKKDSDHEYVSLRQFAAEVLRDAAKDGASGWNLPAVQKIFSEWLERRACEIEGGQ
jgi:hypothetical protein